MTEIEMLKLCAQARGYTVKYEFATGIDVYTNKTKTIREWDKQFENVPEIILGYNPLENDTQLIDLIKKLRVDVASTGHGEWAAMVGDDDLACTELSENLNRAVVYSVARMQEKINQSRIDT